MTKKEYQEVGIVALKKMNDFQFEWMILNFFFINRLLKIAMHIFELKNLSSWKNVQGRLINFEFFNFYYAEFS